MSEIASAFVTLVPSARGFGRATEKQVGGEMTTAGKNVGSKFGAAFKATSAIGITAGVPSAPLFRVGAEGLA